jgi:hypothetical protein
VSALHIGLGIVAALALRAEAQVAVGGVGPRYGVYPGAPVVVVPLTSYPYGGYVYPDPLRFTDELPSCYRFGRCSLRELERFRDRAHRLDRLAPAAPDGGPRLERAAPGRASVAPTPEENIRPEYRGASVPRTEFEASGRPR